MPLSQISFKKWIPLQKKKIQNHWPKITLMVLSFSPAINMFSIMVKGCMLEAELKDLYKWPNTLHFRKTGLKRDSIIDSGEVVTKGVCGKTHHI